MMSDAEIADIYDDYSFKTRTIQNQLSAENTYYNNNSEERVRQGDLPFVNQLPAKELTTERMQQLLQEDQDNIKRVQAQAGAGELALLDEKQLLDLAAGEEWRVDLPQPADKCFLCRLHFDSKVKMPLALPCGHIVCRECVIDRESQRLEIRCFYDGGVVYSVGELPVATAIQKRLLAADKRAFD